MTAYDILQSYFAEHGENILDLSAADAICKLQEYAGKYHRSMTEVECEAVLLTACNAQKMRRWESAGQGRLL